MKRKKKDKYCTQSYHVPPILRENNLLANQHLVINILTAAKCVSGKEYPTGKQPFKHL